MALKTDYQNAEFSGNRKYNMIENSDGTVSLTDATSYTVQGDTLGAEDINAITSQINSNSVYSFTTTLTAANWASGVYTISNGHVNDSCFIDVAPATNTTAAEMKAWGKAMIKGLSQTNGSFRLQAMGTVPTIALKAVITIIGGTN